MKLNYGEVSRSKYLRNVIVICQVSRMKAINFTFVRKSNSQSGWLFNVLIINLFEFSHVTRSNP